MLKLERLWLAMVPNGSPLTGSTPPISMPTSAAPLTPSSTKVISPRLARSSIAVAFSNSVSRVTWLMRSIFTCMARKSGRARISTRPMNTPITGTATRMTLDSGTSRRSAMMMPPTHMMGAARVTLSIISTTICTCWMSFVERVISEGVPKWLSSACEKLSTLRNSRPRTSRPKAMAVLEPQ